MADGTPIEWTDATWNPVTGCSVLSAGCTNCYAMRLAGTRLQHHDSRKEMGRRLGRRNNSITARLCTLARREFIAEGEANG